MHFVFRFLLILCFSSIQNFAHSPKREFVIVHPSKEVGLFGACHLLLGFLHKYEAGHWQHIAGLQMDCGTEGLYYEPSHGANWWSYYFEPVEVGGSQGAHRRLSRLSEHKASWAVFNGSFSRQQAFSLIDKYIKVKQEILDEAQDFASKHFSSSYIIGVHYRGTDKSCESPRTPYAVALKSIFEQVEKLQGKDYKIFVATDEAQFLELMQANFGEHILFSEAIRSTTKKSVHHRGKDGYERGREAIIDALLLSKCDLLLRTASNLSGWSAFWNPDVPVIMLRPES